MQSGSAGMSRAILHRLREARSPASLRQPVTPASSSRSLTLAPPSGDGEAVCEGGGVRPSALAARSRQPLAPAASHRSLTLAPLSRVAKHSVKGRLSRSAYKLAPLVCNRDFPTPRSV
jgi:hypothetical protein